MVQLWRKKKIDCHQFFFSLKRFFPNLKRGKRRKWYFLTAGISNFLYTVLWCALYWKLWIKSTPFPCSYWYMTVCNVPELACIFFASCFTECEHLKTEVLCGSTWMLHWNVIGTTSYKAAAIYCQLDMSSTCMLYLVPPSECLLFQGCGNCMYTSAKTE